MFKKIALLVFVFSLLLAACAPAVEESAPDKVAPGFDNSVPRESAGGAPAFEGGSEGYEPEMPESEPVPQAGMERMVIKNASMQIIVNDPSQSMDFITDMAEQMNGFVVSANLYQSYVAEGLEVPRASITIRVPAERLNEAMDRIEGLSTDGADNKVISSQDVTSEYTDLESRLRNLEAAEAQLTEILDQATRTEDVLNVFNQLTAIREQIEVIKGQMKYYEQSAALSSISVELIANAATQPIETGGWEPVGVLKEAIEALVSALQGLASFLIWLVVFILPVLVAIFLPLFILIRLIIVWRRRRRISAVTPSGPTS